MANINPSLTTQLIHPAPNQESVLGQEQGP